MLDPYALSCCKIAGIKKANPNRGNFKNVGKSGRTFPNLVGAGINIVLVKKRKVITQ